MMEKANLLRLELSAPTRVQSFQKAAVPMKREIEEAAPRHGRRGPDRLRPGRASAWSAYESRVRRAMTVADVQKATLGPILGAIPAVRTGDRASRPPELALAEEAIEKTRANLMQQFGTPGGKVVLVTSALHRRGPDVPGPRAGSELRPGRRADAARRLRPARCRRCTSRSKCRTRSGSASC